MPSPKEIVVSLETLDGYLSQVFKAFTSPNEKPDHNWKPEDKNGLIKPGFWIALYDKLLVTADTNRTGEVVQDEPTVFSYVEASNLDSFTAAHQDNPASFYAQIFSELMKGKKRPSSLALNLASLVLQLFKTSKLIITLNYIPEHLRQDRDIVFAALEQNIENITALPTDFFISETTQDHFIKFALIAWANGTGIESFHEAFRRNSITIPKLKVTTLAQLREVSALLAKIQSQQTLYNSFFGQFLQHIEWAIELTQPGDHIFLAIREHPSLLEAFYPFYRDQPLNRQAVSALSRMGSGIDFNGTNITKKDWLTIYENIAPKIMDGITRYLAFLDGGAHIGEKGFFTRFRHGSIGHNRATTLRNKLNTIMDSEDPSNYFTEIKNFFTAPDTRFHNNSLSNYIRRELKKLPETTDPNTLTEMSYEKVCDLFGIDDARFTHDLPNTSSIPGPTI